MSARRRGWTGTGEGLHRQLEHVSGWRVIHCGHPTALFPWYVESPEGVTYTTASGHAWRHVAEAKVSAEELADGEPAGAWPISQAERLRELQKAAPYAGAARKRMRPDLRRLQGEILDRVDAERWRWVRLTHAQTLARLERSTVKA